MSVSTLSWPLQVELQHLLLGKTRAIIATQPQMADILQVSPALCWNALASEVPHCILAIHRSDLDVDIPSLVIHFRTSESLSKPDGELRLRLPGGNDSNGRTSRNVSGRGVEMAIRYSEILDVIRMVGVRSPLGGVPRDGDASTLQSSVVPFPPLHRHGFASYSNPNLSAHVARLLGLDNETTTVTTTLGRQGAGLVGPRLHVANRAMAVVAPWKRILARLLRKP